MATTLKLNDFPKLSATDRGKAEDSAAYTAWQTKMQSSLQVVKLWKYIDGSASYPDQLSGITKQAMEAASLVLVTNPNDAESKSVLIRYNQDRKLSKQ